VDLLHVLRPPSAWFPVRRKGQHHPLQRRTPRLRSSILEGRPDSVPCPLEVGSNEATAHGMPVQVCRWTSVGGVGFNASDRALHQGLPLPLPRITSAIPRVTTTGRIKARKPCNRDRAFTRVGPSPLPPPHRTRRWGRADRRSRPARVRAAQPASSGCLL